jgi:superfamily II RNA helicase
MTRHAIAIILMLLLARSSAFLPSISRLTVTQSRLKASSTDTDQIAEAIQLGRDRLQPYFSFPLDDWQLQAGGEICQGSNVIVCAPTGAGKTVVGEMALHLALERGNNAIYTTPLKALSNQKFAELRTTFGKIKVGLSTGDMSINRYAQLRVMTTEVYRNMAWRSSGLEGKDGSSMRLEDDELVRNGVVVLDEFHYMGQPGRGGVWEESVITTPSHSQIVGLSATLPNANQLAQWMESVSGRKTVLVEATEARPVPLRYLFATKKGLYPLFRDEDAGPGAPNGLLGLRGDGVPETTSKSKKKTTFDEIIDDISELSAVPQGLQINPLLKAEAVKRRTRVNKAIERMKGEDGDSDQRRGGGGGRQWKREAPRSGKLSAREERRERERLLKREMRKEVPSLGILIRRLEQKNLLPAILFIFSRAGCDNAASELAQQFMGPSRDPFSDGDQQEEEYSEMTQEKKRKKGRSRAVKAQNAQNRMQDKEGRTFRRGGSLVEDEALASMLDLSFSDDDDDMVFDDESPLNSENWRFFASAGLLKFDEVKEVAFRVATFNSENEEIAFDEKNVEQFLVGVGSHHAGMLPAHKAFVETLYRAQLMKVVFATETLAAGINMPARTTCICALAKRGDRSTINLLETSNLLQMAGRAGRRGMDTDGTCVILSTPFENEDDAADILISKIKPVTSQFAPSYSLAVNLIARGQGKVDVARRLVEKSFAMWEMRQVEARLESAMEGDSGESVIKLLAAASHERFMNCLVSAFQDIVDKDPVDFDIQDLQSYANLVQDRRFLKSGSKGYGGAANKMSIAKKTLQSLEEELINMEKTLTAEDQELFGDLAKEDQVEMRRQIDTQRTRFLAAEQEVSQHPFTVIAEAATRIMEGNYPAGQDLATELGNAREQPGGPLTAEDISVFAKSIVTMKKKKKNVDDLDSNDLIQQANKQGTVDRDATWRDMLALTKVLVCYGCLGSDWVPGMSDDDLEASSFSLTTAGDHIGMLSFQNSLWVLVGMGGAHDIVGASSKLDDFRRKMKEFDDDISAWDDEEDGNLMDDLFGSSVVEIPADKDSSIAEAEQESLTLDSQLSKLTAHELAGYVSSLISDGYRRGSSVSVAESFQKLTPAQQRVVQSSLAVCERLVDVQKECGTGDTNTKCELDLTTAEVVTAWANGCSWAEALEISGSAPGDLARMLGRALDALRQLGNLSWSPLRASDVNDSGVLNKSLGISTDVRSLCRDAARAMNRFPVKDPLPFDTDSEDLDDDFDDEEDEEDKVEEDEAGKVEDLKDDLGDLEDVKESV